MAVTHADVLKALMDTTPSVWAQECRRIRNRITGEMERYGFVGRPYLIEPHDCQVPMMVMIKGSQIGATELGINRALHGGVQRQRNGLYMLPHDENLRDFVKSRFDPIFETSPALAGVKPDKSSWRQKLIGAATLYFRGSNTKSGLLEIPVDQLIIDEFDACLPASVKLAEKRLGGIPEHLRRILKLSTPTIAGLGVDRAYRASDQCAWVVPCPHCGEGQSLEWGVQLKPDDSDPNARPPWRCRHCGDEWTEAERLEAIAVA